MLFVVALFLFGTVGDGSTWMRDAFVTWDVGVLDPSEDVLAFCASVIAPLE